MGNGSFPEWAQSLQTRANEGDAEAQYQVAEQWRKGNFAKLIKGAIADGDFYLDEPDPVKAAEWFLRSATQGNSKAQLALGGFNQFGIGVEKDATKAIDWYRKAAAQGNVEALVELGNLYSWGEVGVPRSAATGIEWYQKAAEMGHEVAALNLFSLYIQGEVVPKNEELALYWLKKIAAQGSATGQEFMGKVYAGIDSDISSLRLSSVTFDNVLSYAWFNLATSGGVETVSAEATRNRNRVARRMSPTEIAEAERLSSRWIKGNLLVREGRTASLTSRQ